MLDSTLKHACCTFGFFRCTVSTSTIASITPALAARRYVDEARFRLRELPEPSYREAGAVMQLDDTAIRTLELVESASDEKRHTLWGLLDGCRTPMPWRPGPNLGFSTATPWLPAAGEHADITVEAQEADPESVLAFSRAMIDLRRHSEALTAGDLTILDLADPVLGFVRRSGDEAIACLFNMSGEPQFVDAPELAGARLLPLRAGDADLRGGSIGLSPYAAAFLRLAKSHSDPSVPPPVN
jgi:glycosidase